MKRYVLSLFCFVILSSVDAQNRMTPELLWKLGRVTGLGVSKDTKGVVYNISIPQAEENKSNRKTYFVSLADGDTKEIVAVDEVVANNRISPDGKYMLTAKDVKLRKVAGKNQMCRSMMAWAIVIGTSGKMVLIAMFLCILWLMAKQVKAKIL